MVHFKQLKVLIKDLFLPSFITLSMIQKIELHIFRGIYIST